MIITKSQMEAVSDGIFLEKLNRSFSRSLPGYDQWEAAEKINFLAESIDDARGLSLQTEIGIASYSVACWWLNFRFEQQSQSLLRILQSEFLEIRKVHAMNEWVLARLRSPAEPAMADQALAAALNITAPWGMR